MKITRPPALWESGCTVDVVRNEFVIPELAKLMDDIQPASVADLGCGTGYISRALSSNIKSPPSSWHLVDNNSEMLNFAKQNSPEFKHFSFHDIDIINEALSSPPFLVDLAFLAYTLLDVELSDIFGHNLSTIMRKGGYISVFLPDPLEDIIEHRNILECIENYKKGVCELEKTDRFTNEQGLFVLNRIENILESFTIHGFSLINISRREAKPNHFHFKLILRKSE